MFHSSYFIIYELESSLRCGSERLPLHPSLPPFPGSPLALPPLTVRFPWSLAHPQGSASHPAGDRPTSPASGLQIPRKIKKKEKGTG